MLRTTLIKGYIVGGLFIGAFSPIMNQAPLEISKAHQGEIPSFQADVFPLFETKCNLDNTCHGQKGTAFPKYHSYGMIKAKAKKVAYRLKRTDKPMPPPDAEVSLSDEERSTILQWIEAGMPNN